MDAPPIRSTRFDTLEIFWDERVLEPRPWTVLQSRWAVELLDSDDDHPVLELCSGAGHIGLLAARMSGRRLVAVDVSPVACDFMRDNAARADLDDTVEVRCAPMTEALADDERFALVIADPPWVSSKETGSYPADPLVAIDGGDDGLAVARTCVELAGLHLLAGASLLLQLGDEAQAGQLAGEVDAWSDGGLRRGERGVVQRLIKD